MTDENRSTGNESYVLPDHWILDETSIWTIMHHEYVCRAVELVKESGARRVIEVGCGDGWNCAKLVDAGLEVVGVDWSKHGIEHARRMVPQGTFYCGDITDRGFMSRFLGQFDAAILVEVLEHIPPEHCVAALRNISQLLKNEGRFVLTTPSVNYPNNNPSHYRHFTDHLLRELVDEAGGLRVVSIEGYGDMPSERRHWRVARFVHNRFYTIHPIYQWLGQMHRKYCLHRPLSRCHGLIMTMIREASAVY